MDTNKNSMLSVVKRCGLTEEFKVCLGILYHYTTRENLWNIINSNSFYARNVRFSNDSAEYLLGKKEAEKHMQSKKLDNLDDCYMICFCKEDNILSQWREYARGGVSIQMDFQKDVKYTIKCNSTTERNNRENRKLEDESPYRIPSSFFEKDREETNGYEVVSIPLFAVKYICPDNDELKKIVCNIQDSIKEDKEMREETDIKIILPYVKHSGFCEEKEVRLIFNMEEPDQCYMVDYLEEKGMMRPYIKVEFGDANKWQSKECTIKYYNIPEKYINEIVEEQFSTGCLTFEESSKTYTVQIKFVQEDIKRAKEDKGHFFIENCKYQNYVFEIIDSYVKSINLADETEFCVWCDGYLPIRGITVGPSYDAVELCESITHKMKEKYWLNYVKVDISEIPYREKLHS